LSFRGVILSRADGEGSHASSRASNDQRLRTRKLRCVISVSGRRSQVGEILRSAQDDSGGLVPLLPRRIRLRDDDAHDVLIVRFRLVETLHFLGWGFESKNGELIDRSLIPQTDPKR
jgi:hypothetical protein